MASLAVHEQKVWIAYLAAALGPVLGFLPVRAARFTDLSRIKQVPTTGITNPQQLIGINMTTTYAPITGKYDLSEDAEQVRRRWFSARDTMNIAGSEWFGATKRVWDAKAAGLAKDGLDVLENAVRTASDVYLKAKADFEMEGLEPAIG